MRLIEIALTHRSRRVGQGLTAVLAMLALFVVAGGLGTASAAPQTCKNNPNCVVAITSTTTPPVTVTSSDVTTSTSTATLTSTISTTETVSSTRTTTETVTETATSTTTETATETMTSTFTTSSCATYTAFDWSAFPCP